MQLTRRRFIAGGAAGGGLIAAGGGVAATTLVHGIRRWLHGAGALGGPDKSIPSIPDAPVAFSEFEPTRGVVLASPRRRGRHASNVARRVRAHGGSEALGCSAGDVGSSMGAFGALLAARDRPEMFRVVVASSPSLWRSFADARAGAFDSAVDFAANDVLSDAAAIGRSVRIDCGEDDPFADTVRSYREASTRAKVRMHAGFHEDATWRSFLPAQLEFVTRALA
jgi:hypothetical protein